jgi:hypothetical protein
MNDLEKPKPPETKPPSKEEREARERKRRDEAEAELIEKMKQQREYLLSMNYSEEEIKFKLERYEADYRKRYGI